MLSMRSTTSSGVGTHTTSLPCWPTWGLKSFSWAYAALVVTSSAAARAASRPLGIARSISSSFCLSGNCVWGKANRPTPRGRSLFRILQRFGGVVGEARALAALESYVTGMSPAFHAVDDVGQSGAALGEVGGVDLRDVAQAHHLGSGAGPGDQGLHLLGRQVLRFVDDEILVDEGAATHEIERLDLDPRADQVARGGAAPLARLIVGLVENVEIVLERPHPGRHFLLLGARQETDVLADRHGDPGHDDLGVVLGLERLHKAGGECKQGLAGPRLAEQRHEVDFGAHEEIEREVLLAVARRDAPDVVLAVGVVARGLEHRGSVRDFLHRGAAG